MKRVVVFDFDGTLTVHDTFREFAVFALGRWRFLWSVLLTLPQIVLWKLGLISSSRAKQALFKRLYAGESATRIAAKAEQFVPVLNDAVVQKLNEHLHNGDTVYIISASLNLWVNAWARRRGVNHVCCTEAEIIGDVITGRFASPNCRGEEKVRRLLQRESPREAYHLTVYGNDDGDSALWRIADTKIISFKFRKRNLRFKGLKV